MTARQNPASEPGRAAIRAKPVRVTAGLDPATYTELNRWWAVPRSRSTRTSRGCRWRRRSAR